MANKCPTCNSENPENLKFCGECGTKLDASGPSHPLSPGSRASFTKTLEAPIDEFARGALFAGRYEIIEEVGAGGMGRVYRVHDTKLNEEVALKLIRPEIGADKRTAERFRNEIKIARKIRHKNVCGMYDFHEEGQTLYLTMEYVRGEDLKSLIHRTKTLTVGASLAYARQIAEGLAEAHKLGIVHRDLKPGNVMIDKDGQAKIMDFGIARVRQDKGVTGEGAVIGTPEYMSPEQVEGHEADQRSDIYALGVILFEMVTGRAPFEGDTPFSIANKHRTDPPPIPRKLVPQIPEGLSRLILRCLEKEREKRYQTAEELLADLATIEEMLPTTERVAAGRKTITRREVMVKFQLRKLVVPVAVVAGLTIAGLFLWRNVIHRPALPLPSVKPNLVILNFANMAKDPGLDAWTKGLPDLLTQSLSASRYIQVVPRDQTIGIMKNLGLIESEGYSTDELGKVAKAAEATHVATGSLMTDGPKITLTLAVYKAKASESANPLKVHVDNPFEISSKIYVMARQVKLDMGLTPTMINSDYDIEGMGITTPYPQALKLFFEATDYLRKVEYAKAVNALEQAVAIDPEFAMAFRYLSAACGNLGRRADWQKYMAKALELADRGRLSQRERLHIYATKASAHDGDSVKAAELYEELLQLNPLDILARNMLGREYGIQEKYDLAVEQYEIMIKNGLDDPLFVSNFIWACLRAGAFDRARELGDRYHTPLMESPNRAVLWTTSAVLGDFDQALAEADEFGRYGAARHDLRGDAFLLKGDFLRAQEEYQLFLKEPGGGEIYGLSFLYYLLKSQGKFINAREQCRRALETSNEKGQNQDWTLNDYVYLSDEASHVQDALRKIGQAEKRRGTGEDTYWYRALLYLKIGNVSQAQVEAQGLKSTIEKDIKKSGNQKKMRSYDHIMGRIALARNDKNNAISYLKAAAAKMPTQVGNAFENYNQALYLEPLARVYFEFGDLLNSKQTYEKITSLTRGRIHWGEVYARSFYQLGKIAEQQGDEVRAITNYRKFLDLWKDADPGLPEVEDARKRLAGLTDS